MTKLLEKYVVEQTFVDYTKWLTPNRQNLEDTRETLSDVVIRGVLLSSMKKINADVFDDKLLMEAMDELTKDRLSKSLYEANKEVYWLLKNGYQVEWENKEGEQINYHIYFIDWEMPTNNSYHYKKQFHIKGAIYNKEPDLVYFVNGLPLIVVECKNSNQAISKAYDDNISDYIEAIPQLFVYNQLVVLTNGVKTKVWAFTSSYEHYYTWKKVESEKENANWSMQTAISGLFDPMRMLDLFENFILFDDHYQAKIVAKNHQYLWVNNVFARFLKRWKLDGKLWVYRHTQGSGKSYSMMFVVQKILRKVAGNFTFVIVTDRTELDSQITKGFTHCGLINDPDARAESIADLKKLLSQDKRVIFTLIHKFDEDFAPNQRDDIIVMTDEAHRSQYGDLAMRMRNALPRANFLGFTGTPLIQEEAEPTKKVFGGYVSVYNFSQSIEDGATVPIYYDNFTPKVVNENPDLAKELEELQNKFTNADDEEVVEHKISLAYAILTRDDVLDEIAQHISTHFASRGVWSDGKAMVVCIDKLTAVKMYWKVRKAFEELWGIAPEMGVMISLWDKQEEDRRMAESGGNFSLLRKKIQARDGDGTPLLEKNFKDAQHPLKIVFVCSMWLTGFDAKNCTTLYLQKPMKGHTLMQTIARTNRVYKWKTHGLIVDYVNVFSNLQNALSLYASPELGDPSDVIQHKSVFVEELQESYEKLALYLEKKDIALDNLLWADATIGIDVLDAVERIIVSEESYKEFFRLAKMVEAEYQALLPDPQASARYRKMKLIKFLRDTVREALGDDTVSKAQIYDELQEILDRSIKVGEYKVTQNFRIKDLSKIDYTKLKEQFGQNQKNTIIQQLAKSMKDATEQMIAVNPKRKTLMEKLEKIMETYNKGSKEIDEIFEELIKLSQEMTDEEQRAAKEEMTEEQLAVFDLLWKEDLQGNDEQSIKRIAKELLDIIKPVIQSSVRPRENESVKAEIKVKIDTFLYNNLPTVYDDKLLETKSQQLYLYMYQHMRELV